MDHSRDEDLKRLSEIFKNPNKPQSVRRAAFRSFQNIQKQVKDKKLADMRLRLIRGIRAKDMAFVENMTKEIELYSWKKGYSENPPEPQIIELPNGQSVAVYP